MMVPKTLNNMAALASAPIAMQPLSGIAAKPFPLATMQRNYRPSGQARRHIVPRR
jgi:hypothetical protein